MLGVVKGGVGEQGADRGQAGVAGPGAVATVCFQVVEEGAYDGRVEVLPAEPRGRLGGALLHEAQQEPQGVAVGGDGVCWPGAAWPGVR